MSCPYALVIFDCDGVLVHLGPVEPKVRDRLLREQGIVTDIDAVTLELHGFTNEQIFAHLETKYGAVITPEFGHRYISLCYEEFETSVTAIEGVAGRTLDGLRLTGTERGIYLVASAIPLVPARPIIAVWRSMTAKK